MDKDKALDAALSQIEKAFGKVELIEVAELPNEAAFITEVMTEKAYKEI